MPGVTVAMAAYNAETTIACAMHSVLGQSLAHIELILVDDASRDETAAVVSKVQDPRLKTIRNVANLGPGISRDLAIGSATSPWIAFVDADDYLPPNRLKILLDAAIETDVDIVFDDTMLCHDTPTGLNPWKALHGTKAFGGSGVTPREIRIEDYIASNRLLIHPIIRTDFIRQHGIRHSKRRFAEDAEFYLRLALAGAKFCYVPEPLYHYRITPGSLTAQAKDPTMMRKCLEECSRWEGWSPTALDAFRTKIASLRRNEALYDLSQATRRGQFIQAFKLLMSQPHLLATLPYKLVQQIRYQAHRISHGGHGR